jgi:competence protein ComEC
MKKLKIFLLFSLTFLVFIYVYYKNNNINSIYTNDMTSIEGIITDINYEKNKISFIVKNKENILVNDYKLISDVRLGDYVHIEGIMKEPQINTNFNLFNYKNYLLSKRVYHTFTLDTINVISNNNIFYKLKNIILDRLDSIDNSYLYTFILADNRIDDTIYDSYQINGISHLFAISGMQITLLSLVILFILNKFIKRRKISYIIISLLLILYMFLTGFTASVVRSCLVFIFITIFKLFNIKIKTIYILYLVLVILLLYNPYYIYDIGFVYSFTISFALILLSKNINNYENYFIKLFITSLIAFIVSIPITINNNFSINLLSPLLNLIFVPYVTFIITPISIMTLVIPDINNLFIFLTKILEYLSSFFLKYQIELIYCHIPFYGVIIYYLIIGLMFYKPNKITVSIFIFLLCIHYNIKFFNKNPILTMIDVGQGDSFLIEMPYGKANILIDTGGNTNYDLAKNILIPFIKSKGIKHIDYLILSHGDYDHMGASTSLINKFKVNKVIMNSGNNNDIELELIDLLKEKNISYEQISKKVLSINGNNFYFLNILNSEEENNDSLILYTKLNNYGILFMGDATVKEEKILLDTYNLDNVDILKVGHHGSKYSTGDEFISKINPSYALISVSKSNYYGHPSDRVISLLDKCDTARYQTSIDGSVKIIFNDKLSIYTCLNGSLSD